MIRQVRGADRPGVLRLGRDPLALPVDPNRHFRTEIRATNYGFLYIAQGVGSILGGPAAAFLKQTTGSWTVVFILVACLDALTALLAVTALKTMRLRHFEAAN